MAFLAPIFLVFACLGAGTLLLTPFRVLAGRSGLEIMGLAFASGFGVLGWIFFWLGTLGLYTQEITWVVCAILAAGVALLFKERPSTSPPVSFTVFESLLLAAIAIAVAADFLEALAPPVEADTLAYHFQLPKQFIEEGRLLFVPRALDGAIPLLVQMTYVAVLLLSDGNETALTLWAFLSGWAPGLLLFVYSRRWLARHWSLALVLLFHTLPALLYSSGSGQVEPRLVMFTMIAAFGCIEIKDNSCMRAVLLIALGAGFFAASKYTGLLFVAAAGLTILTFSGRRWLQNGLVFSLIVIFVGSQWYGWNAYQSGDPIFPVLFTTLGLEDSSFWDADYAAHMKEYMSVRNDQISWWQRWLSYPVVATLFPAAAMEAGRVGLGPYFLMVAPFALTGVWHHRAKVASSTLAPAALMAGLFYILWLGFGSIPKVRHLIPILPIVLVCLVAASNKAVQVQLWLRHPLGLAMILALAINAGVVGFFMRPYVTHALNGFDKEAFLTANVNGYPAVSWLNQQEGIGKVLLTYRAFQFYVQTDSFFAYPGVQKQIEVRAGRVEPGRFWRQLKIQRITHILTDRPTSMSLGPASADSAITALANAGCLEHLKEIQVPWKKSRTLALLGTRQQWFDFWQLNPKNCSVGTNP